MILRILPETHPRLRLVCEPVKFPLAIGPKVHAQSLMETMNAHKALGVASNQTHVAFALRIIAVNLKEYKGVMFNPVILERSEDTIALREGCLSRKEEAVVLRAKNIKVEFKNKAGESRTLELQGLSAVVVQHEIDHLDGKLTSDYL